MIKSKTMARKCDKNTIRNVCLTFAFGLFFVIPAQCTMATDNTGVLITVASNRLSDLGEGPYWDPKSQTLLYVDAFVGDVCRLEPQSQETEAIHYEGQIVTFVIPSSSNARKILVSVDNEIRRLHWDTRSHEVIAIPEKNITGTRFNDAKCDVAGRLWAGSLSNVGGKGSLYQIDNKYKVKKFADGLTVSNGITWTLDNKKMFYIDSEIRTIYVFDFNEATGDATNQRVFLNFNEQPDYKDAGYPDGMTTDLENKLWVACFAGGRILRIDPVSGELLRTIKMPVSKVTSVAFGGPHYTDLYVTTAKRELTEEEHKQQPLAGAVFKITGLGVGGRPAYTFGN